MEIVCKRHTEIPHTSKLFGDLLYRYERVAEFYPYNPLDPESFAAAASKVEFPDERRRSLISVLRKQNGDSESLNRLAKPGTVAVVTGQQVGLFSGPAYTIYKALTAVRLARDLSAMGIEAVPVFWLATEDHDLAEVSSAWTFNGANLPLRLALPGAEGLADVPVGQVRMAAPPVDALAEAIGGLPFGDEVIPLVREAYQPGRTMGEAFAALLRPLLDRYGLLFFDPLQPEARQLAVPMLRKALEAAPELTSQLLAKNARLAEAGYHAQVHVEPHTSLFFLLEGGRRIALRRKEAVYVAKNRNWSVSELSERAEQLSPNAILRPVIQDSMIPTAAYIGGPAELAYLAQSRVIYDKILGRMPVATPRNGFTIFDERSGKLMKRYGLTLDAFFAGEEAFRESIASKLSPPEVEAGIARVSASTKAELSALRETVKRFDPTLAGALDKSAAKMEYQLAKMQRKIARECMRRSDRASEEATYLFNGIFPHKHLQERFYTILPFLARHGLGLIDQIYETTHLDCHDHHLLFL